jgi:hypothetical protein
MSISAMTGAARDLLTTPRGEEVSGVASLGITIGTNGLIAEANLLPASPSAQMLVGKRVGFGFRSSVKDLLAELSGTPLGLLVDDLSGAPAPSGYGAIREQVLLGPPEPLVSEGDGSAPRGDVCAGWRVEGSAYVHVTSGRPLPFVAEPPMAPDLSAAHDPLGWHPMEALGARQSRRIRRMDLWREGDRLMIDAMFRDSTADPDLTPRVVHEYAIAAVVDSESLVVQQIRAEPRSLPFPADCPLAAESAQLVVGLPITSLRGTVGRVSNGPGSCTHLNDALRFLADAAVLVRHLPD